MLGRWIGAEAAESPAPHRDQILGRSRLSPDRVPDALPTPTTVPEPGGRSAARSCRSLSRRARLFRAPCTSAPSGGGGAGDNKETDEDGTCHMWGARAPVSATQASTSLPGIRPGHLKASALPCPGRLPCTPCPAPRSSHPADGLPSRDPGGRQAGSGLKAPCSGGSAWCPGARVPSARRLAVARPRPAPVQDAAAAGQPCGRRLSEEGLGRRQGPQQLGHL